MRPNAACSASRISRRPQHPAPRALGERRAGGRPETSAPRARDSLRRSARRVSASKVCKRFGGRGIDVAIGIQMTRFLNVPSRSTSSSTTSPRPRQRAPFGARAAADGARAEHFARPQELIGRDVGDHLLELPVDGAGVGLAPDLVVHASDHAEIVDVGNLVCGDEVRSEHVAAHEVLALRRTEADRHLARLDRALAEVVVDHVAEDVVAARAPAGC